MYWLLLVRCAVSKLSMEKLCDKPSFSSDRLFFYLGKISVETITDQSNRLLEHGFQLLWKDRWHHRPVLLAIDTTDQVFQGADNPYVHFTVKTRGLKTTGVKVLRYATLSIVARRFKFTLAAVPVRRDMKMEVVVEQLVSRIPRVLKVRAILMDKGFYHSGVMQTCDRLGIKYIIPCKQYPSLDNLYRLFEATGHNHWKYTMHQNRPNEYRFDVYLEDNGVERYAGFATNMDMSGRDFSTLSQAYRFRWNIENGYKEANEFRIKTSSRNHGYRVLTTIIGCLLVNLHSLAKRKNKNAVIEVEDMKKIFLIMLDALLPEVKDKNRISKHLTITY